MRLRLLVLSLQLASLAIATRFDVRKPEYILHEKRAEHPAWKRVRRLEGHATIPLRIGLKQRNIDLLPGHLMSVSDPASSSYGQHWTSDKIIDVFAPTPEANDTVHEWLMSAGFDATRLRLSHNKAWLDVHDATVHEVEQLLNTEYHVYEHETGEEHAACHSYFLPKGIEKHVDIITPTVQPNIKLSAPSRESAKRRRRTVERATIDSDVPTGCDVAFTLDCLRTLYNISYTPQSTDRNTFGIVSHGPANTYLQSDLDTFFRNFSPALVGKSPQFVSIDGGSVVADELSDVGEDGWIFQYAVSLVQPQPVIMLQVGGKETGNFLSFNEWLDAVDGSYCTSDGGDDFIFDPQLPNPFPGGLNEHSCGIIKPPNVISNSQADHEYRLSEFYMQRQCNEYAKLGLMGVTILYSAGNVGVAGTTSGYCLDKNGSMNLNATNFNPGWPGSCPWVTIVGGTQVRANVSVTEPQAEEVWNQDMTSGFFESGGGGFSNHFLAADYQKQAVKAFLQQLTKTDPDLLKHFNKDGRAYPDLSANANLFVNVDSGEVITSSGTSGATPTIGSIITLVNDARITAGKKPVGFINPAIYSHDFADAFNDIVVGTNQGCKGLQGERGGGFKAVPGWDPASGVGTPNVGRLIEKWLTLP